MFSHGDDEKMKDFEPNFNFDYDKAKKAESAFVDINIEEVLAFRRVPTLPRPQLRGDFAGKTSFDGRVPLMEKVNSHPSCSGRLFKRTLYRGSATEKVTQGSDIVLFNLTAYFADDDDEIDENNNNVDKSPEQVDLFAQKEPFETTYPRSEEVEMEDRRTREKRPLLNRPDALIPGYALALLTMSVGEMAEFAIHWSLAFGQLGCPQSGIPPTASLIVIFEVVDVYRPGTLEYFYAVEGAQEDEENVLEEEREECFKPRRILAFAAEDWKLGNEHYYSSNYTKALFHYRRTAEMLERRSRHFVCNSRVEDEAKRLLLSVYSNAASCGLKLSRAPVVLNYARRTLRIDPDCAKAFFQLAQGCLLFDNDEGAAYYLARAQKLRPFDADIAEAFREMANLVNCKDCFSHPDGLYEKPKSVEDDTTLLRLPWYKLGEAGDDQAKDDDNDDGWKVDEKDGHSADLLEPGSGENAPMVLGSMIEAFKNQPNGENVWKLDGSRFDDFYSS